MGHTVSRPWRWWLLGLAVVAAVVVAAVELMSWNFLKPTIEARVEAATGREFTIHDDISVDVLPSPRVSLHELTLANPAWADRPHLFEATRLSVSPSLLDLLKGRLVLSEVELASPRLALERRANAPGSWVMDTPPAPQRQGTGKAEASLPIRIPTLRVSNARLRYRDAGDDSPHELSLPRLQMHREDDSTRTEATLTWRERRWRLEADTTAIGELLSGNVPLQATFALASDESRAEGILTLAEPHSLAGLELDGTLTLRNSADWAAWLGLPPVELETLTLATRLQQREDKWHLREIEASALGSRVTGDITLATGGRAPRLQGRLHATTLDVGALRQALPARPGTTRLTGVSLPVLPDLRGEVTLAVDRLAHTAGVIEALEADVRLAEHRLDLESLRFETEGGQVEATARMTRSDEAVSGQAEVSLTAFDLASLTPALPSDSELVEATFAVELSRLERRGRIPTETLLANLHLERGEFVYRTSKAGSRLDGTLTTAGDVPAPHLALSGEFRDKPLELHIEGDPLPRLITATSDYRLHARASSGKLEARADTTLASIRRPDTLGAKVGLAGENARDLQVWLGPAVPSLPAFRLAGRLDREGPRWRVSELDGEVGGARLAGDITYHHTDRPAISADLDAGRIVLARFLPDASAASPREASAAGEAPPASRLAPLRAFDAELELGAETLVLPDGLELDELVASATLEQGQARLAPLRFRLGEGTITADLALDARQAPASGRLDVELDAVALGQIGDTFTPLEERLGRLSGRLHLTIVEAETGRGELRLPFLGRLTFGSSTLRFQDPEARTDVRLTLETRGLEDDDQHFRVSGEGRYEGGPMSLRFRGDPLLDARDPERPYTLDLEARFVDSRVRIAGSVLQPLALQGLNLAVQLEGPDTQRLSRLLGLPLPNLPPYSVYGELALQGERWILDNIAGEVGDSDLAGTLTLDTGVAPPRLTGSLQSRSLDIADLGVTIGARPDETDNDRRVLPDARLIGEAWDAVSADVRYRGNNVRAGGVPLNDVVIDLSLAAGHWRFDPLRFGVGEGNVDLVIDLDARQTPARGTLQLEVRGVNLAEVLRHWDVADDSVGIVGAQGKFWVQGDDIAQLLASADGGLVLLMTGGRLDALMVELAGLDASQLITSWLRRRQPVAIDCAYADLQARDGVTELDTFVVDTPDTGFTAGGEIDFNTERLDITVLAHPKDPSVLVGRSPLHLGGTFRNIETGLHAGQLATRVGSSALLGAIGTPVAALLPLLDLGTGEEVAYCGGMVQRVRKAIRAEEDAP